MSTPTHHQRDAASSEPPTIDTGEIDRVLRQRRKQHESRSCVPCKRRKVGCDNAKPCATCKKREHPEICVYEVARHRGNATPKQKATSNWTGPTAVSPSIHGNPCTVNPASSSHNSGDGTRPGSSEYYSIASIVQSKAQQTGGGSLAQDVSSVLGLQNTLISYPFMDLTSPDERWCSLLKITPHRQEILSLLPNFQMRVFPFNPLLVDMAQFELVVHKYLQAYMSGEFKYTTVISVDWGTERSMGLISLILAVLSSGAHFSDLDGRERFRICYDLARRSFQALRLANFLFRPTLETVQTMLILGNTLQNTGQSDAAWAWLGTTARLAQTLDFHARDARMNLPEAIKSKAKACWLNIIWQDTLLSLCHARRPLVLESSSMQTETRNDDLPLTYNEFMHAICRMAMTILNNNTRDVVIAATTIEQLDRLHQKTQLYLRFKEHCKSSVEHLQHLALKMHKCFFVTFISRPAIRNLTNSPAHMSPIQLDLRKRAEENLVEATRTFLEFRAVSSVPLRSWSMVHTALSSVLLLCIWEETRAKPECQYLREKVIEAFSTPEALSTEAPGSNGYTQWLSPRHIHALVTLKDAFTADSSGLQLDHEAVQAWNTYDFSGQIGNMPGLPNSWAPFEEYTDNLFNSSASYQNLDNATTMNPSPINYLDSIMGGPIW